MGMSYNTGTANAIISGTITATATVRTVKSFVGQRINGNHDLGTCPAGKKWIITRIFMNAMGSSTYCGALLKDVSNNITILDLALSSSSNDLETHCNLNGKYEEPLYILEEGILRLIVNVGTRCSFKIDYIEEDA